MIRKIILLCVAVILVTASNMYGDENKAPPEGGVEKLFAMSFEDLLDVKVVTAQKRPGRIIESPSPIYVFTAEDIKRLGVRNIMELVKYVPGFYVYPRVDQPFVISSRGLRTNNNDNFLFLIDGIPLNNVSKAGAVNEDNFPGLEKVKRVEIISGPGSTMWGSNASTGIFHVITKDGKDIDGHVATVNMATEDNHVEVNFLSGKEFYDSEYMFSATYAQTDGYGDERYGYKNYIHDFETVSWNDTWTTFNHLHPSYEIYGKFRYKDFTIKGLVSDKRVYNIRHTTESHDKFVTGNEFEMDRKATIAFESFHLELSHHADLSDNMTLDSMLAYKDIEYTRSKLEESGYNHGSYYDDPNVEPIHWGQTHPEKGVDLSFIFNWDINEKNKLLAGAEARITEVDTATRWFRNVNTGEPGTSNVGETDFNRYEATTDKTYGVYVEDTFQATDNLTLIGGIRVDYNDPRETTAVIMPRGAVIYKITDTMTAKYMYNTGYVRPYFDQLNEIGLEEPLRPESEKIQQHDVAFIYQTKNTQFLADVYYRQVYDLSNFAVYKYVNDGDIFTQGIDISLKRSFLDGKLVFDLVYGYATAEKEDDFGNKQDYDQGIPYHLYAAGVNYSFTDNITFHADVTGWADLQMNNKQATSVPNIEEGYHPDSYSGEYLVNMNLIFANLFNNSLDLSLYVLNALDNEARLQAYDSRHAWWGIDRGRSLGIRASWTF